MQAHAKLLCNIASWLQKRKACVYLEDSKSAKSRRLMTTLATSSSGLVWLANGTNLLMVLRHGDAMKKLCERDEMGWDQSGQRAQ